MPWGSSDARRGWAAQWRNPHGPYRIVTLDPRQDVLREAVLGAIDEACFPLNTADEIPEQPLGEGRRRAVVEADVVGEQR